MELVIAFVLVVIIEMIWVELWYRRAMRRLSIKVDVVDQRIPEEIAARRPPVAKTTDYGLPVKAKKSHHVSASQSILEAIEKIKSYGEPEWPEWKKEIWLKQLYAHLPVAAQADTMYREHGE